MDDDATTEPERYKNDAPACEHGTHPAEECPFCYILPALQCELAYYTST